MSSPFGRLVMIAEPAAGRGRVGEELPEIERQLQAGKLRYRFVEAAAPGEATRLAREALAEGDRFLVAVGDDDTLHDVVNGMVEGGRPVNENAVLGMVAAGSGSDFVRTFGLPGDAIRAVRHLGGHRTYPIDAVAVRCMTPEGGDAERVFVNVAQVGFGAGVVQRSGGVRSSGLRHLLGFWRTLATQKPFEAIVRADRKTLERRATNVIVANAQYRGGGMRISPRSYPGDGLLDVQVWIGPRSEAFTAIPKLYRGEHVPHPNIKELRGREISVTTDPPVAVEVDGRVIGHTPATFSILHEALRLKT
ncbi:MAG TPA: diacylglycerol kinase family protein [Actinomycetota bacterium]|nr:diacylglycerol kinase family protein [Actinomycetota bacterium]